MKPKANRRSFFVIFGAIGVVAFILLAVWHLAQQEAEPPADFAANDDLAATPAAEPDVSAEPSEVAAKDAERMDPARRIVHVPNTRGEMVVTRALEPSDYMGDKATAFLTEAIDRALAGDVVTAGYIRDLTNLCTGWVPPDAEALERMVETAMSMVSRSAASGNSVPAAGRPWLLGGAVANGPAIRVYPTEHQIRAHLLEWQRSCRET